MKEHERSQTASTIIQMKSMNSTIKSIKRAATTLLVALSLLSVGGISSALADQESSLIAQRHPDVFKHRALEAAVWAMPMMNFKGNRDGYFANGVTYNDVGYFSTMQDSRYQLATPNDTTPYFLTFWNLKKKPVVIEMPAATKDIVLFGTFMDSWHRPIEDFGPQGADQGKGAKYLILPPGYEGKIPDGFIVVQSKTYEGYMGARPIIPDSSQKSVELAANYVRQLKVYNLGESNKTRYVDMSNKTINSIANFDDTYFDGLNELLQVEPVEEQNKVMMGMLKSIGIKMGQPFNPGPVERKLLKEGAQKAHEYMVDMYHNVLISSYYEDKYWQFLVNSSVPETGFTFIYPDYIDLDNRAALFYAITSSVKKMGGATAYISSTHDSDGVFLDGSKNYHLKIDANVPARQFWSATAYDFESAAWMLEQSKVSVSSKNLDLQYNKDGSADLYFGPDSPKDMESNWIPTTSGKQFFVLFRFYGPEKPVFDKSWQLNDIEMLK